MKNYLSLLIKKITVTLRFSFLSIFLNLFIGTILVLIALTYFQAKKQMLYTANQLMKETSEAIIEGITQDTNDASTEIEQSIQLIQNKAIDVNNDQQMKSYLAALAKRYLVIKSAFWANEKGKLIIAETEIDGRTAIKTVDSKINPYKEFVVLYDTTGRKTSQEVRILNQNLDPRLKNWYQIAKKEKRTISTKIYSFDLSHGTGFTTSKPVFDSNGKFLGIFGVDIGLNTLSYFVEHHKVSTHGVVFIVTKEGKLVAFPHFNTLSPNGLINIQTLTIPWLINSFEIYQKTQNKTFNFQDGSQKYLARYESIPYFANQGWLLGVVAPEDDFIHELKKMSTYDILIGLILLLIGSVIVSKLVTNIIKPIKELVNQTNKIKNFELGNVEEIHSRITEVILLSEALKAMRLGLKSFQQYIPASLVRQLIEVGENVRIGGIKKPLTILFSDIKNFTTLAESMSPNLLMEHMCEYFEEFSKIIISEQGTIDKYIGDSIMAFWGAPLITDNPEKHAAETSLKFKYRLTKLNKYWEQQGKKPLITRIGIHSGDAIVGNVGSPERMNYTALGDSINIASRLESANKIYGTRIIVSQTVYEQIKNDYLLRMIDYLAVKGKKIAIIIYELLAKDKAELNFDLDMYQIEFKKGFDAYQQGQWDKAIKAFENCLKIYAEDTVAPVFIKRCIKFTNNPPSDWDGVWRVEE